MKIFLFVIATVLTHSFTSIGQTPNAKIEREIIEFRTEIREAVKAKDRKSLERFFADGFTHTHASGKVDGKAERVDFFLKGEPTIEDVEPEEIRIVVHGKDLATAIGKTSLLFGTETRTFQWTGVFYKSKGRWQQIATHATLIRN
ncbi:MAG TPA: nuclear transport factor 2 family protein [Pyrinomonadaceae bacterium]|nr:nuclear transport factor 2 family protein [Pyrinomonadaceae bacterium]